MSDGALTPNQLIDLASERGVDMLSITDHDTLDAYAHTSSVPPGMRLIPGIELSSRWRKQGVHIVGLNIDLSKIKTKNIFKWIKSNNISDQEMLKTFNCGVGFCLIVKKQNIKKIKKYFSKEYMPYEIGYISKDKKQTNVLNKIKW